MRGLRHLALTVLAAASACSSSPALPSPAYTRASGLPGFLVECRNTTPRPVSPIAQIKALRLDGVVIESKGMVGSFLGGLPPDVVPGGTWTHLVVLHPDKVTRTSSGLALQGAILKTDWGVPLSKGRHSVAFQCAGEWTGAVSFEW